MSNWPLAWENRQTSVGIRAVSEDYGVMRSEVAEVGRFLNSEDVDGRRRVVFLGAEAARRLFGNSPAVGQTIRIKDIPFDVIGVGTNKVQISNYGVGPDKYCAFIPFTVANQIQDTTYVSTIVWQMLDPIFHDQSIAQAREILSAKYRFDAKDERA